jgi:hypothetical protein
MLSILFVTQKPPTTFIAPKTTAIRPTIVVKESLAAAREMTAPTSTMPCMAFVALIRGVWRRLGTREINSNPRNAATTKIASWASSTPTSAPLFRGLLGFLFRRFLRLRKCFSGGLVPDLTLVRDAGRVDDLILEVEV